MENSRGNLLLRSEELDVIAGAWSNGATNASASAETFTAPDFETDADFLYFQNDNWFHLWEAIDGSTINYPSRSLFLVTGEQKLVRDLYLYASSSGYDVWTLNGLRNDNSVKATIIKNAWTIKEENVGIKHTMAGFDYSSTTEQTITFNDLDEE